MSTPQISELVTGLSTPSSGGSPVADRTGAVFTPSSQVAGRSQMTAFTRYCEQSTGRSFPDHAAFHAFSVEDFRTFWRLFLEWSGVPCEGAVEPVCEGDDCETAKFFPNLRLNYAEVLLGHGALDNGVAITARHVNGGREQLTRGELRAKACRLAAFLVRAGVVPGDRVAVIARNGPEAIIAALATASVGAVFSSCAPEMGPQAILSRLAQLKPVALIGQLRIEHFDSRVGGGDVGERFSEVVRGLESLHTLVALDDGLIPAGLTPSFHRLSAILADEGLPQATNWQRFPASHPLFILFSSGTTGAPKCIVHSAGGTLIEHLKELRLHCDLRAGDKLFFQTSCAWMMWNWQLSALACGVEMVLYDGPLEGPDTLWRIVADEGVNVFGTSPAYLQLCEGAGFEPHSVGPLDRLRAVLSTGSILYPRQYDWVRAHVGPLPLQSISGGTDIIGCFLLGNPNLPVHRGDAQCCSLAMDVRAIGAADDRNARLGELICTNPFPSRPLGFFGDASGERFHAAYFAQNPGVWTHGDLIEFTPTGGVRLQGRSDGVLNVRGIRVGPAEIYAILQDLEEIEEAMAVEQQGEAQVAGGRLILLVVLRAGVTLDDALILKIRSELVTRGSPALLPARIADVPALPKTHNGKASEVAAGDVVNGRDARNRAALRNPESLDPIAAHPALQAAAVNAPAAVTGAKPLLTELERLLRGLAQEALGLTAVENTDNLNELGADSLAIVTLTLEIGRRLGCQLPFSALVSAPTISGLAAYIVGHWAQLTSQEPAHWGRADAGPHIREATLADAQAIRQLLDEGFKVSSERPIPWERLLDHGWLVNKPRIGLMLMDGEKLVGFLGLVYATRRIQGQNGLTCNLSSWYVKPQYRGWGAALISEAVKDASVSYTAFTPVPLTRGVLSALGFTDATVVKHLFLPLQNAGSLFSAAVPLSFDTAVIESILNPEHLGIFRDHQHCEVLQAVMGDADAYAYLVVKKRRRRIGAEPSPVFLTYTEILFCSNWTLLTRDFERVKLAFMKRQKTVAMMVDDHLIKGPAPRSLVVKGRNLFCSPNFIRSATFRSDDIDKLYSELVLLPI